MTWIAGIKIKMSLEEIMAGLFLLILIVAEEFFLMSDDFSAAEINYIFSYIGGRVGYSFKVFGN